MMTSFPTSCPGQWWSSWPHSAIQGQLSFTKLRQHQLPLIGSDSTPSQKPPSLDLFWQIHSINRVQATLHVEELSLVVLNPLTRLPLQLQEEGLEIWRELRHGLVLEGCIQSCKDQLICSFFGQIFNLEVVDAVPCPASKKGDNIEYRLILTLGQLHLSPVDVAPPPELLVLGLLATEGGHIVVGFSSVSGIMLLRRGGSGRRHTGQSPTRFLDGSRIYLAGSATNNKFSLTLEVQRTNKKGISTKVDV